MLIHEQILKLGIEGNFLHLIVKSIYTDINIFPLEGGRKIRMPTITISAQY